MKLIRLKNGGRRLKMCGGLLPAFDRDLSLGRRPGDSPTAAGQTPDVPQLHPEE